MGDYTTGDKSPYMPHVVRVGEILETGQEPVTQAFNKTALAKGLVFGALGPAGMIADLATSYAEKVIEEKSNRNRYLAGIEKLADKKIPGFGHAHLTIDDKPVQLAVDSSALIDKPDGKPWVYSSQDPSDPRVQAELDKLTTATTQNLRRAEQQHQADYAANQDDQAAYRTQQKEYLDALQFGDAAAKENAQAPKSPPSPVPEEFALAQLIKIRETQLEAIRPPTAEALSSTPESTQAPQIEGLDRMSRAGAQLIAAPQPTENTPQPTQQPVMAVPPHKTAPTSATPSL